MPDNTSVWKRKKNLADHKLTLSQVIKKNPEGSLWNVSCFINLCLGQLGDFWNLEEEIIVSLVPLHLLSLSSHREHLLLLDMGTFPSGKALAHDR